MRHIRVILISIIFISVPTMAREIFVPGDFPTIRSAVKAAGNDDSIIISPGVYNETVLILRPNIQLHLIGKGRPTLKGMIKVVNARWLTVKGFNMVGGTDESHGGIVCERSSVSIKDMEISGFHHGVMISSGSAEISNSQITDSFNVCLQISYSDVILTDTVLSDSGAGIIISGGGDVVIRGNLIIGNEIGVQCVDSKPILRRNLIKGNGYGLVSIDAEPDLGTGDEFGENSFIENEVHIGNQGSKAISAIGNYWGRASGPLPDSIEGRVDLKPWLMRDPLKRVGLKEGNPVVLLWAEVKRF
jgi:nitrous oxidase accessory protein NosD